MEGNIHDPFGSQMLALDSKGSVRFTLRHRYRAQPRCVPMAGGGPLFLLDLWCNVPVSNENL